MFSTTLIIALCAMGLIAGLGTEDLSSIRRLFEGQDGDINGANLGPDGFRIRLWLNLQL